ncbi:hypothetical protein, conserved [Plasmodium gonderi]|uniref:C2H2-type domain-containing protein n=1 Tax=Plasmodium gonderi TaxID=77519 RepID=A0A1Y1JEN3_PLAGO|nr:hypothetical protein, conserved [Plasmodium gonderi]GAW79212.1 hypothetical protein, conserved [Plasmodium gonderi]
MDKVMLKYIFDELCTSFNKKEVNSYNRKKEDNDSNIQSQVNYSITLQELFENLERNKNMHMDIYMKREVLQILYYSKDVSISQQGKQVPQVTEHRSDELYYYNDHLDHYNNHIDLHPEEEKNLNLILNAASQFNLYINNIYIYNKHNLFYYERIKECKEKIFILLYIISGKYNGLIQSSLSKYLNLDVKMVHYHLKVLFQYLIIKKISMNIRNLEQNIDCNNNNSHSGNRSTIKLNPSYILYFNIYFIYNLLPIFIKNVLYAQNVLSINKIILYLLNKFVIIPQKTLSLIFFKLLIVYNPYYFIQIKKALKIFNSILSNLTNTKKIIMCKIKIHSSYENCYLNYENKDKINYENIINFLILFYYNYDYLIKFINKSCYLMCEDYVKEIEFENEFVRSNITTASTWNQMGTHLKNGHTFNHRLHNIERNDFNSISDQFKNQVAYDASNQNAKNRDPSMINCQSLYLYKNENNFDVSQNNVNKHGEEKNIVVNEKNCNLLINEFKIFMDSQVHNRLDNAGYYSSSQNGKEESSDSDFYFLYGNNVIEDVHKKNEDHSEHNEEGNKESSPVQPTTAQPSTAQPSTIQPTTVQPTTASTSSSSDSDNNAYIKPSNKNGNIYLNDLSMYNKIKYLIMSKGIRGITTKEISHILFLSIKKTNTFLSKLLRNKDIVKIPERKDKSFMYRFIDNYIYQYVQKKPQAISRKSKEQQNDVKFIEIQPHRVEVELTSMDTKGENFTEENGVTQDEPIGKSKYCFENNKKINHTRGLCESNTSPIGDNDTNLFQSEEKLSDEICKDKDFQDKNFNDKNFSLIQFNKLNESLNVLNYTNTVNEIDIDVLTYVIPKHKDSVDSFNNYKDFIDNYVKNFKNFEDKYDLYTCSFHLFYYLKFVLKQHNNNSVTKFNTDEKQKSKKHLPHDGTNCEVNEIDISIKNVDSSEKNINFIKYFMEDTTKLKSNLFIKRLFIFCHFLLSSKVTTFRYLQDLFFTIENNGRMIDRKSVQRLFNYSIKVNNLFKKYTLLNSKTVKYYFYDSNVLSEKQSNDLYTKFQHDYAISSYKYTNSNDKTNKEKTEYYNINTGNIINNKYKHTINISNENVKNGTDSADEALSNALKHEPNMHFQIINQDHTAHFSSNFKNTHENYFIDLTEYPENSQPIETTSNHFSNNYEDKHHTSFQTFCDERETNIIIPNNDIYSTNDRCNPRDSNTSASILNNNIMCNLFPEEIAIRSSKRKIIEPTVQMFNKRIKTEQLKQISENIIKLPTGEYVEETMHKFNETDGKYKLNDKNENFKSDSPTGNPKHVNNDVKNLNKNEKDGNVLYIDILNESAFKCKENRIISKKKKKNNAFQNFKTSQEFSYSINYFNGYIFSKMARYKYFHKCLIRILKRKKRRKKNKRRNTEKKKKKKNSPQTVIVSSPENPKKRKLSYIEEIKKKKKKNVKKRNSNVLSVKDILKNLYLDEYLRIISIGCKLNYIGNYLLHEKQKKRLKDLPTILFEFLTSYSMLNCTKQNMIENFILSNNKHLKLDQLRTYEQYHLSLYPNSNSTKLVRNTEINFNSSIESVSTLTMDARSTHVASTNQGKLKKSRTNYDSYEKKKKKKKNDLCQHDINIIKSSDKICVFFFFYRKLKFLCNMNLIKLKFYDMNKNFTHKRNVNTVINSKSKEPNLSFLDLKKKNLRILIKKNVHTNLFRSKKTKKKLQMYNMLRYNHFEEYYYNIYLAVERFKKFLVEARPKKNVNEKLTLQDILKSSKIKNKGLKFLLLHNSYANQLFMTRKLRNIFLKLVKKVRKRNIGNSNLSENLTTYREYNTLRELYNVSKTNIEKYFAIFYDWYNKEKNGYSTMSEKDLTFSCPFCRNMYFFKNDLLSHISNVHNVNKKFSQLISFFSNSKQTIHRKLSDFLKIKDRAKGNLNVFFPVHNFNNHVNNINQDIASIGKKHTFNIEPYHPTHNNDDPTPEMGNSHNPFNSGFQNQVEKVLQMKNTKCQIIPSKATHFPSEESNYCTRESTQIIDKQNETSSMQTKTKNTHNEKNTHLRNKNLNHKQLTNFIEKVKVKYSLRIVYIYFVTVIVKLAMSQKYLEKMKKKKIQNQEKNPNQSQSELLPMDKPSKNCEIFPSLEKKSFPDEDFKTTINTMQEEFKSTEITNAHTMNDKKRCHIKKKLMKEKKKSGSYNFFNSTHSKCYHKKKKQKCRNKVVEVSHVDISENRNDFASIQLRKFHVIYHLKNRTNTIPYRKKIWVKANNMMIGKFQYNICMYIQKKLFLYFKKNIVHYFFILSNESLARCILNYFATHIYNCTYTNINYYYDKYIKNIYNFKFISLVNLLNVFIINYGDHYSLYKEIIKPLYFQKIQDIRNALKYIKKKNYIVDTSYVLSNYVDNDLVCDNVYSYLIYKSIFYKKKLTLSMKKSFLDNTVMDIMYLYGVYHSMKFLESTHENSHHRKANILNYQLKDLMTHIDNVYNNENNPKDILNFQNIIPNNDKIANSCSTISAVHHNHILTQKSSVTQDYHKNINLDVESNNFLIPCGTNTSIYEHCDYTIAGFDTNNAIEKSDCTSSNAECQKHYFQKSLTIFDLNYYIHNFIKGNIILYASNNYIIADENGHYPEGHYENGHYQYDHYEKDDNPYNCEEYESGHFDNDLYSKNGTNSLHGEELTETENEDNEEEREDKGEEKSLSQKNKKTGRKKNYREASSKSRRRKTIDNSITHKNFKRNKGNRLNNGKTANNKYMKEDKTVNYNSSSADDSDIFDNLSDDFEIIKLLENTNFENKKPLGGIGKHIRCLTKHVSEYFPNYYILNNFQKKKIEKKLSQIFSNGTNKSYSKLNNSLRLLYYNTNYNNNTLFTYFKKYCLHIQHINDGRSIFHNKRFKNYFLLNINSTYNYNFINIFDTYVQKNNFTNTKIYQKNKILIYNLSNKTFIDFDWYPQNIHLYNIAYVSNASREIDSMLDTQVSNLKNSVYWLEIENIKRGRKKREIHSAQMQRNKVIPCNPIHKEKGTEISQMDKHIEQRKETHYKSMQRNKKSEGYKNNTQKNNFVKKVKVKKIKTKNMNNLKESFIFVTQILYHVFNFTDILNMYDDYGNYQNDISEKKTKKKKISEEYHQLNEQNNDTVKTRKNACSGYTYCAHSSREESENTVNEVREGCINYEELNEDAHEEECLSDPMSNNLTYNLQKGQSEDEKQNCNENNCNLNQLKDIKMAKWYNIEKTKNHNQAQNEKVLTNNPNVDVLNSKKSSTIIEKIMHKMIFIFLHLEKKKKKGLFMDNLKKMYLYEFLKKTSYRKYIQVKKEYDFILFFLHKLNLINIFPFMNTHKIFLSQYHSENNAYKRKNLLYEHNLKYPFLNMINCHLMNFKLTHKMRKDSDITVFKKFIQQVGETPTGPQHNEVRLNGMENTRDNQNILRNETNDRNTTNEKYTGKKITYKGKNLSYADYIYINYINNKTLRKPNFIPTTILLFNLPCCIIIHDYFFLYLLEYFCKMQNSISEELKDGFKENAVYRSSLGDKLLCLIENETYPRVIRYIKRIISKACRYFENRLYLYKHKMDSSFCNKITLYYFNDNFVNVNSFIYVNGSVNVKFIFFYILKIFFYLKANPYSSIFDIYKSVEILNFCDLSFLLRGMCQDNFISFKLMYVSERSEMYKLNRNYKIVNYFNNLVENEKLKKKKKNILSPFPKKRICYIFDNSTSSSEGFSTDDDILNKVKICAKNGTNQKEENNGKYKKNNQPQKQHQAQMNLDSHKILNTTKCTRTTSKKYRDDGFGFSSYDAFLEKMMHKKVKLYYVSDEALIFEKYNGTLWG